MKITTASVVLAPLFIRLASGFVGPFPLGVLQCLELCASYRDCYYVAYSPIHLRCELLAERRNDKCGGKRCPKLSACLMVSEIALTLCWTKKITRVTKHKTLMTDDDREPAFTPSPRLQTGVFKEEPELSPRHVDTSNHALLQIVHEQPAFKPSSRETGMLKQEPELSPRHLDTSNQALLQIVKGRRTRAVMQLLLVNIKSGHTKMLWRSTQYFYSFTMVANMLIYCQGRPDGLFLTPIVHAILVTAKRRRLDTNRCTDVVGDKTENVIFFTNRRYLCKMALTEPYRKESRFSLGGRSGVTKLAIDTKIKRVYVYRELLRHVTVLGYSEFDQVLEPGARIYRLAAGSNWALLIKATPKKIVVLSLSNEGPTKTRPITSKKDISAVSVVKDKFVVISGRTMRVYQHRPFEMVSLTELKLNLKIWTIKDLYAISV